MTDEGLKTAQAQLTQLETEIAALSQTERECIERARQMNDACRVARTKRTELTHAIETLRQRVNLEVTARAVEAKRIANEQAAKEAAEKAAKAAAEPKPPSELEQLRQELAALREEIKAGK